jgi:hypothetical protein
LTRGRGGRKEGLAAVVEDEAEGKFPVRTSTIVCTKESLAAVLGVLALWGILGIVFVRTSADDAFSHDFDAHLEYTRLIAREHRLPSPIEARETFQPPLYYLLASLLRPQAADHVRWVRLASVALGGVTLALVACALGRLAVGPIVTATILLFLATTPKFLFLFTSYNNDALATPMAVAVAVLAHRLWRGWRWPLGGLLVAVVGAGAYTKSTVLFAVAAIGTVVALAGVKQEPGEGRRSAVRILGALALGVGCFAPWAVLHNHRLSGSLFPVPCEQMPAGLLLPEAPLRTILTPPGITSGEWADPFTHQWDETDNKKSSYLAYLFVTSVLGEFNLTEPGEQAVWLLLWLHLFVYVWAVRRAWRAAAGRAALGALVLTFVLFASYLFRCPYAPCMDYRFVAWTWLPWAVVYAQALRAAERLAPSSRTARLRAATALLPFVAAVALQLVVVVALLRAA